MNNTFNRSFLVSESGLKEGIVESLGTTNKASISIYKITVLDPEGIFQEAH